MITDPTSLSVRNVTPHCSQITEVLDFFKQSHKSLEALELMLAGQEQAGDAALAESLAQIVGGEGGNLLARLLRIEAAVKAEPGSSWNSPNINFK